jgi:teichoic acid transport system permease protein
MAERTLESRAEDVEKLDEPPSNGARAEPGARDDDEFTGNYHVYEPYKVGLPPLGPYLRELRRRRDFALTLSRTKLRAKHFDTALGQVWLVLTPLLMACVYFMLVMVIRGGSRGIEFFAHLTAALFLFQLFASSVREAVNSIVGGGRLILNTAFPRVLLPLSSVVGGFRRFLPTVPVYLVIHVIAGVAFGWAMLLALPIVGLVLLMAAGFCCIVAAAQVYFRDLSGFLPHVLRIWLYSSPILYTAAEATDRGLGFLMWVNPMAPLIRSWSSVMDHQELPDATVFAAGAAWAVFFFVLGLLYFISRERELAVRI